jgi:hypothetical protein
MPWQNALSWTCTVRRSVAYRQTSWRKERCLPRKFAGFVQIFAISVEMNAPCIRMIIVSVVQKLVNIVQKNAGKWQLKF